MIILRRRKWADCSTKSFLTFEHKGMRIFLITKGCSKKKMLHPIFLNNGVGLCDESATFLHNFSSLYLHIIRKWLTICVFAGLTRNLILSSSNATRCVPTPLIGCSAGSRPARKMRKNTPIVPRWLLNESERFRGAVGKGGNTPYFHPESASLQRILPKIKNELFITYLLIN